MYIEQILFNKELSNKIKDFLMNSYCKNERNERIIEVENIFDIIEIKCISKNSTEIPDFFIYFRDLKILNLHDNKITTIENIYNNIELEELNLSENQIRNIEGLDKLIKLKQLLLNENQITKIEGLDKLNNLSLLNLKKCNIKKIENLENNTKLETLFIFENPLKESKYLIKNESILTDLKEVKLQELYNNYLKRKEDIYDKRKKLYQKIKNNKLKKEKNKIFLLKQELSDKNILLNIKNTKEEINFGF